MNERPEINRLEYLILNTLYDLECKDHFHSMTITEIMDENEGAIGKRMTVYKKLRRLVTLGYVKKGCVDDHADTFYISNTGIGLIEGRIKV